jgi:lipopolysaccharide export system permease protein
MTGIVWITQILKLLYLIEKGINLIDFFNLIVLAIPSLLLVILPFVTVFATIYTYHRLEEERQLIILKNSGLNFFQLAYPALLVSILVALFSYYISSYLLPLSYNKLKADINVAKNAYVSNVITEKTFNQISKDIVIYTDKKLENGVIQGVIILDNRNVEQKTILLAKYGKLGMKNNHPIFHLTNGIRQSYDKNHQLTKLRFDSFVIEIVNNNHQHTQRNLHNKDINEYYINELLKPDPLLSKSRQIKLIAEGHQRLIWPLYNFVLAFLSISVFFRQPYNRKTHIKQILFPALAVIMVTYLHFTFHNLASRNLDFIVACYANFILAITYSIFLCLRKNI